MFYLCMVNQSFNVEVQLIRLVKMILFQFLRYVISILSE